MLVLTQVFKPSVVIAQHISRNVTLSGRFTSGSSHSLPLAGPSSSSSHSLPLAGPSSSRPHSLPLAGPSSSSSHSYPVVATYSIPHTLPAARPSFSGPHTPLVAGPTSSCLLRLLPGCILQWQIPPRPVLWWHLLRQLVCPEHPHVPPLLAFRFTLCTKEYA